MLSGSLGKGQPQLPGSLTPVSMNHVLVCICVCVCVCVCVCIRRGWGVGGVCVHVLICFALFKGKEGAPRTHRKLY